MSEVRQEVAQESELNKLPPDIRKEKIAELRAAAEREESAYQAELEHEILSAMKRLVELKGKEHVERLIMEIFNQQSWKPITSTAGKPR